MGGIIGMVLASKYKMNYDPVIIKGMKHASHQEDVKLGPYGIK
ncbi:hypothetical protein KNCP2_08400 [Candidatus Rickettsia kedanie]|uniref:Uncharacterized protein n=1 Tax=Candidatus Rickettsia kedanie TaxID=3115352 RepID=A0ABP9TTT8_9RICK